MSRSSSSQSPPPPLRARRRKPNDEAKKAECSSLDVLARPVEDREERVDDLEVMLRFHKQNLPVRPSGKTRHLATGGPSHRTVSGVNYISAWTMERREEIVPVNLLVDASRRLAHPCRRELPIVSGVQRSRVGGEHRDLVLAAPVVDL